VAEIERWSCMESRLVATSEVDGANPSAMWRRGGESPEEKCMRSGEIKRDRRSGDFSRCWRPTCTAEAPPLAAPHARCK
jgi:hypothetical protein